MEYSDFTLPGVLKPFGLTLETTADLYANVVPAIPDPAFLLRLADDTDLALAISTEKARSEFIIAPILSEVRRMARRQISLLSGVDFSVDASQGLIGVCDYIITRSEQQYFVEAPVLLLVEAKNEDMKRGYGQCLAEMIAAQKFNARSEAGVQNGIIYGAVTIGERWKFLQLSGTNAFIDSADYYLGEIGKIMAILLHGSRGNRGGVGSAGSADKIQNS